MALSFRSFIISFRGNSDCTTYSDAFAIPRLLRSCRLFPSNVLPMLFAFQRLRRYMPDLLYSYAVPVDLSSDRTAARYHYVSSRHISFFHRSGHTTNYLRNNRLNAPGQCTFSKRVVCFVQVLSANVRPYLPESFLQLDPGK